MSVLNRNHVSVASLIRFLQTKKVKIRKSSKPNDANFVSLLIGEIEDAVDEMGKQEPKEDDFDFVKLLGESSFHLEGVSH